MRREWKQMSRMRHFYRRTAERQSDEFNSRTKVLTEGGTTEDGDERLQSRMQRLLIITIDWNRLQE